MLGIVMKLISSLRRDLLLTLELSKIKWSDKTVYFLATFCKADAEMFNGTRRFCVELLTSRPVSRFKKFDVTDDCLEVRFLFIGDSYPYEEVTTPLTATASAFSNNDPLTICQPLWMLKCYPLYDLTFGW